MILDLISNAIECLRPAGGHRKISVYNTVFALIQAYGDMSSISGRFIDEATKTLIIFEF